jgi:bifunctional non-homologous end joining protein LigD
VPLPQFQPLPVARRRELFDHPDLIFEPKHDGFRCIAYVDHGRCRLVSRNGNEFKSFRSLNAAIADELNGHSAVLDSEIVSLDKNGKSQFYELFSHRGEARLCAFDLLWCDDEGLHYASLIERKRRLRLLIQQPNRLFYCDHVEHHGKSLFQIACEHDLEDTRSGSRFEISNIASGLGDTSYSNVNAKLTLTHSGAPAP